MDPSAPGWYPDPTGRHERRYWSGIRWSRHVDDGGQRSEDPLAPESGDRHATPGRGQLRATTSGRHTLPPGLPSGGAAVATPEPLGPRDTPGPPRPPAHATGTPPGRRRLVLGAVAAVVVVLAGAVLLTSQGDDGDGAGEQASADDPLKAHLVEFAHRASGETIDDAQANCMADNILTTLGRERLVEADVMAEENPLNAVEDDEVVTAISTGFDCLENADLVEYMAASWNPARFGGIPDAAAPCVFEGFIEGWGRERAINVFGQFAIPENDLVLSELLDEAELSVLGSVISECGSRFPTATTGAPVRSG